MYPEILKLHCKLIYLQHETKQERHVTFSMYLWIFRIVTSQGPIASNDLFRPSSQDSVFQIGTGRVLHILKVCSWHHLSSQVKNSVTTFSGIFNQGMLFFPSCSGLQYQQTQPLLVQSFLKSSK